MPGQILILSRKTDHTEESKIDQSSKTESSSPDIYNIIQCKEEAKSDVNIEQKDKPIINKSTESEESEKYVMKEQVKSDKALDNDCNRDTKDEKIISSAEENKLEDMKQTKITEDNKLEEERVSI